MSSSRFYRKWIFLLPLFYGGFVTAQTHIIDSVKKVIAPQRDGHQRMEDVFLMCEQYRSLNPDTLAIYYNMAAALAEKYGNTVDKLRPSFYKGIYLVSRVQLDSAQKLINETLSELLQTGYGPLMADLLFLRSRLLIKSDKQKESIANSMHILQSAELANDTFSQIKAKVNVGWAYMELSQNQEALKWFWQAFRQDSLTQERYTQTALYANMAAVYNNLSKNDSAEHFAKRAIAIAMEKSDLTSLANSYFIYAGIDIELRNNTRAEKMMQEGLKIRKLIGDPFFIVSDIFQLGNFYAHIKETSKGIAILNEGIAMAHQYSLHSKLLILYTALAENYQTAGDYKNYGDVLNTLITLKDSMYTKNSADALSDIQTKYEVQKKQNIIISQQLDLTKKNNLIFGTFILLAATVLVSYVIFRTRKRNQQLRLQEIVIDQKKKTLNAVMQAEENERKRIAGELHDSVAQKMVVAKLNLEVLESYLPVFNGEQQQVYNNIFSLVDESCTEVRNLSHSMMPQAFFQSGLVDAIRNFIDKIENKNLRIICNVEGDLDNLDKNTELMVYRVIQECLQNIIKHAEASKVDISIIAENNELDTIIEDNGIGFDTSVSDQADGMGMKNIRSRIDFLNGKLDINSTPGSGTVVAFYIPLKQSTLTH